MTSAKIFDFTSMLTMLHEVMALMDTKILMSVIKARCRAPNSSKLRSATLFAFYNFIA